MVKKNMFIAFEGIDGSGKSTQSELLAKKLEQIGHKVYHTCEPSKGKIGKLIRSVFIGKEEADPRIIAGMFVADRLEHILNRQDGILKKMQEGYTVITDRFYFSSYAYQGVDVSMDWIMEANSLSVSIIKPDVHFFIDIAPEKSMDRITENRQTTELFENIETLKKVRENYKSAFVAKAKEENVVIINGMQTIVKVQQEIWSYLLSGNLK